MIWVSGLGAILARHLRMSLSPVAFGSDNLGGLVHVSLETPAKNGVFSVERRWRLSAGHARKFAVLKNYGSGYYKESNMSINLYSDDGVHIAEIWSPSQGCGKCTAFDKGNSWGASGNWEAANMDSPRMWFGLQFKGGAGLVAGLEGSVGAVVNSVRAQNGASMIGSGWRFGAVAGASGGLALLLATGFQNASEMNGFVSDGADWALSFGPKWSGIVKGLGKLQKLEGFAHAMLETLDNASRVQKVVTAVKNPEITREIYGIGKALYSGTLIDDEYKAICAIDIPFLGAGAEIGVYYAKTTFKTLSEW